MAASCQKSALLCASAGLVWFLLFALMQQEVAPCVTFVVVVLHSSKCGSPVLFPPLPPACGRAANKQHPRSSALPSCKCPLSNTLRLHVLDHSPAEATVALAGLRSERAALLVSDALITTLKRVVFTCYICNGNCVPFHPVKDDQQGWAQSRECTTPIAFVISNRGHFRAN